MKTIQLRTCSECSTEFTPHDVEFNGRVIFNQTLCDNCSELACKASEEAEKDRVVAKKKKTREDAFLTICPPLYRDTGPQRIHPRFREASFTWSYSPQGIGFIGIAGIGKTRAAYLLI